MAIIIAFLVVLGPTLGTPAAASVEPFGQETVEVRPWRNPPRPSAQRQHRHNHSAHPAATHSRVHDHHRHGERHTHSSSREHGHPHGPNDHRIHGVETEHLFGFTKGTDIDPVGTKHFIADW